MLIGWQGLPALPRAFGVPRCSGLPCAFGFAARTEERRMPPCTGDTPQPWRRAAAALRAHWLIAVLGAAGVTLRALTLAAYHPALIYVDALKYLYGVYTGSEPLGYAAALRLALLAGGLG